MRLDIRIKNPKKIIIDLMFMCVGLIGAWITIMIGLVVIIPYTILFSGDDKWDVFFKPMDYFYDVMSNEEK
jgi:hypothetical protein